MLASLLLLSGVSACQIGTAEGKKADRLVLEGKHEAAEELYRIQLTHLESQLLDAPTPELQVKHRVVLEKLAKLNQHRLRRYEAAITDWKRLIETHPDSELAVEAGLAVAELYRYRLERPNKAIEAYETLREKIQDPLSNARVGLELAELLFEVKRYEQVEELASEVQQANRDPKLGYRATFLRARALTTLERHNEAVEAWSTLELQDYPVIEAQVLFEKSFALEASGARPEAIEALHQALVNHPNPSLVQGMLTDLKTRTQVSEGGRAVHGAKTPPRRAQESRQGSNSPLTSPKKTVKAPQKAKAEKPKQPTRPKKLNKVKTPEETQASEVNAVAEQQPKVEPKPAKDNTRVAPSKVATPPGTPPTNPNTGASPKPDTEVSDTPN